MKQNKTKTTNRTIKTDTTHTPTTTHDKKTTQKQKQKKSHQKQKKKETKGNRNTNANITSHNQKRAQGTKPTNKIDKRKYKKGTHKNLYQSTIKFTATSITSSSSAKIWECPVCKTNNPNHNNTCTKCQGEIKLQTKHKKTQKETNTTNLNQHNKEENQTTTKPQAPITKHKKQDKRKRDNNIRINIQK